MGEVIYERVITGAKLQGRKNCEIRYVRYDGNFSDISFQAFIRNITLAPISQRKFNVETLKRRASKWVI